jgi:hypothetical protein
MRKNKPKGIGRRAWSGSQKTEDRKQKTDDRRQMTEDGCQRTDNGRQRELKVEFGMRQKTMTNIE